MPGVFWHRAADYYKQAAWSGTIAQDGGCLMNQCIHGKVVMCGTALNKILVCQFADNREEFLTLGQQCDSKIDNVYGFGDIRRFILIF